MEETSSFTILYWNLGISTIVHNPDNIRIALGHESFKLRMENFVSSHDMIEIFPKYHLSILVFRLEVVVENGHHPLISQVIHVACHCCPIVDVFHIIRYDPYML